MANEFAKAVLDKATTPLQRVKAVRVALRLGMPLCDIERYLDWLDGCRSCRSCQRTRHAHGSAERNPETL